MSLENDIRQALFTAADTLATTLGLAIDFPNTTFDPGPKPKRYLEVRHFPNQSENPLWGNNKILRGILQISIVDFTQSGEIQPTIIASQIVDAFERGTEFQAGSTLVRIEQSPAILGMIQDGHKATYPVSIRYRCSG